MRLYIIVININWHLIRFRRYHRLLFKCRHKRLLVRYLILWWASCFRKVLRPRRSTSENRFQVQGSSPTNHSSCQKTRRIYGIIIVSVDLVLSWCMC